MTHSDASQPPKSASATGRYVARGLCIAAAALIILVGWHRLSGWVQTVGFVLCCWRVYGGAGPQPSVRNTPAQIVRGYRDGLWRRPSRLRLWLGHLGAVLVIAGIVLQIRGW